MAEGKRYNVCIPRQYKDGNGNDKTHFWQVGTAFPMREQEGFSVKLWSKLLVTDQLVLFVHEEREARPAGAPAPAPQDDDIPF
jgi:hypothetical protein